MIGVAHAVRKVRQISLILDTGIAMRMSDVWTRVHLHPVLERIRCQDCFVRGSDLDIFTNSRTLASIAQTSRGDQPEHRNGDHASQAERDCSLRAPQDRTYRAGTCSLPIVDRASESGRFMAFIRAKSARLKALRGCITVEQGRIVAALCPPVTLPCPSPQHNSQPWSERHATGSWLVCGASLRADVSPNGAENSASSVRLEHARMQREAGQTTPLAKHRPDKPTSI